MMLDGRSGEAIAPLRRAANLGAPGDQVWPLLAQAFAHRGRLLAAYAAAMEAKVAGSSANLLEPVLRQVAIGLGPAYERLRPLMDNTTPGA
jgi:hypothetical protein